MMTEEGFWWRGGDRVEVERVVSGGTAYYPANVVNAPSVRKKLVWVEHESLFVGNGDSVRMMKEYVTPTRLRPSPPREIRQSFKAGDEVDVFIESEGFWVRGNVRDVIGNLKYVVEFKGGNFPETEVDSFKNLRLHREWVDGNWVPSLINKTMKLKIKFKRRDLYEKGTIVEVRREEEDWYYARIFSFLGDDKYIVEQLRSDGGDDSILTPLRDLVQGQNIRPVRPLLLSHGQQWINPYEEESCKPPPLKKLKSCERTEKVLFNNGMMVEVRSNEPGYEGAWYSAKIINFLGKDRYTVEYQTLRTEDYRELLKEEAKGSDLRPNPPQLVERSTCRYELYEDVDAWYNDGWWSGRIYKINSSYTRYGVYFKTTDEILEFGYSDLRPCQVWIKGKWSRA